MNSRVKLLGGLALGAALLGFVPSAEAAVCQSSSISWTEVTTCGAGRWESWGTVDGSGNKALSIWEKWGVPADSGTVVGRTSSGAVVSTCQATDTTIDIFPVTDSSGCNTAVKHTTTGNYY